VDRAACKEYDTSVFFPEPGDHGKLAMGICAGCLVVESCLEWALRHEDEGVWGGVTARKRRALRTQRGVVLDPGDAACGPRGEVVGRATARACRRRHEAGEVPCEECRRVNAQAEMQMRRSGAP